MSQMFNNYVGKAGQLFAMSEFLMLGWNVAIPEVDRGDDIFVVKDDNGELKRVQVKSSHLKQTRAGYTAQFSIPRLQIINPPTPEIFFLLLVRGPDMWSDLLVIERPDLYNILQDRLSQTVASSKLTIKLTFSPNGSVKCGQVDFTSYKKLNSSFNKINH